MRHLALKDIKRLCQNNIEKLDPIDDFFASDMNKAIINMIDLYQQKDNIRSTISIEELEYV